jgi:hypothetical protein
MSQRVRQRAPREFAIEVGCAKVAQAITETLAGEARIQIQ